MFLVVGFEGILLSGCMSLPIVVVGLSTLGFLGICLVQAIVPIDYNGKHLTQVLGLGNRNNGTNR